MQAKVVTMANEERPGSGGAIDAGAGGSRAEALEVRIARVELELAALQRRMGVEAAESETLRAPSPPPMPSTTATQPASVAPRQDAVPQQWAGARTKATGGDSLQSFEERLGSQIFNRIAIVLLLIGTAYGLKLAVDRGFIGPTGRVLAGLAAGVGLVVWSERFRRKGAAAFSYSLKAVGSGILYLTLWASFQIFHLLPAPTALAMMIVVTAWNAYMAWVQNSELLAVYALAGGFATPLLVSSGGNHEVFLFAYLLAIDIATVALVRLKSWPRLLVGAFPSTIAFFIGWYARFFVADELMITAFFIAMIGAIFASVPIGGEVVEAESGEGRSASLVKVVNPILLPLANAAFVALAFYSVLQDSGHHALLPWLMIALAAVYLGLMQARQSRVAAAIHLSLAVVFLTIAVPLKASGHWITVSWLVEGVALLWVAARIEPSSVGDEPRESSLASITLRWLGASSLLLGFCGACFHVLDMVDAGTLSFLNKGTGTAVTGIAAFAAAGWLALKRVADSQKIAKADDGFSWSKIGMTATLLIGMTAALLTVREVLFSWRMQLVHAPFQTGDFFTAFLGLAIFAALIVLSLRVAEWHDDGEFWRGAAAFSTIAFNLIAVLTGVREVSAVWNGSSTGWSADAALRQALAISAFLMIYGAALLAFGFWKRSGFLRWQSLVLLGFTILKTFLYDMRNLSQGYRVASVLGLGALLMAISFAYQKDWLNLRGMQAPASLEATAEEGRGSAPEVER